ncbi:MAG TPA: PAS domain S-box protein [Coleofasciculaceae cyanobacterium]|jgi:PAS domain S-box-containing protein
MLAPLADRFLGPFIPHGHCYLWKPWLVGLHLVSDSLIALAYYSIPLALVYFVRKRRDLPFNWIFLLFGAFIVACGTTHILAVWTLWYPTYWLSGFIKAITAAVSVWTAVLLMPLIPKALALPSPAQLEAANHQLESEIRERKAAESKLQNALQQLRFHVENTPLAVIEVDSEFRVQRWSQQATNIFGWQAEEVLNHRLDEWQFVFEEDAPRVQQDINRLIEGSQPHILGKNRNYTKDGSVIYCEWYNSALWNQSGELVSILSLALDVTERTRAEEALKASEARYRTLVETSPDAITVTDLNDKVLFCNRQVALLYGCENEIEILGVSSLNLIAPEDHSLAAGSLERILTLGSIRNVEYTMLRKDGSRFPAEVSASLIRDAQGNPQAIISLVRDITERKAAEDALKKAKQDLALRVEQRTAQLKQVNEHLLIEIQERRLAEEAFRQSEERLKRSLSSAHMVAWDWDIFSDRLNWSDGVEAILGLDSGAFTGSYKAFLKCLHPDDRPIVIQALNHTIETGTDYEVETRIICPDGTIRWVASKGAVLRNPVGVAERLTGTIMDITERKQVELALERERQQLKQIITCVPVAMAMFDTQMRYLAHSQKWLTTQGLEGQSIIGRYHYDIFPDIPERWKVPHQQALRGEIVSVSEDVWERADGTKVYLRWAIHPWYTPDGAIGGIVLVTDYINELVEAREVALEAARIKSEFLANMSHEIRTPMNGVLGVAGLLLQTSLSPQQLDYARAIRSSAEHLLNVINDILDFSKLEVGEMQLEHVNFDLDSCIDSVVDVLASQAEEKGLELAVLVESDVPRKLLGDPGRLRQILLNLVGNAIKFTDAGEVVVLVEVKGKGQQPTAEASLPASHLSPSYEIQFAVKDTGIGISAADQQKLFQSFSQVDASTTRQYGGTGLGLVICKQLVELMGGDIGVESVLGQGSSFWFTASFDTQAIPEATAVPIALSQLKLLVVCDQAIIRQSVRTYCTSWGMQIDEAADTTATLEALRSSRAQGHPYDVVIVDLQLPDSQGTLIIPMIRSDPSLAQTKLIVMTTSHQRDLAELESMDICSYLIKPMRASRLFDSLMSACGKQACSAFAPQNGMGGWVSGIEKQATIKQQKSHRFPVKILLVEDHPVNQMVILNQLQMLGFQADCVDNGKNAIAKLSQQNYDIVLMDCQMPVLDGYETTKELRRCEGSDRHTVVIALTAHALPTDRDKCLASGMDDYLSKPIEQEALGAMIEQWAKHLADSQVKNTLEPSPLSLNEQRKAEGRGQKAQGIYPDAEGTSNLSAEKEQGLQSPTGHSSVAPVQAGSQSPSERNPLSSASCPLPSLETPLDLERLNNISRGKVNFQQRLVETFVKNAQPGLDQMRVALQVNDFVTLEQQAHRIKGASANVGVRWMPDVAAQLEKQAREKTLEGASDRLETLERQLEQVKTFLKNWLL